MNKLKVRKCARFPRSTVPFDRNLHFMAIFEASNSCSMFECLKFILRNHDIYLPLLVSCLARNVIFEITGSHFLQELYIRLKVYFIYFSIVEKSPKSEHALYGSESATRLL